MQNPLRKLLLHGLAAATIALGVTTMPANAAEKFIFAHAMNTDHVFHALSERSSPRWERTPESRSPITRAVISETGCRCSSSPCRASFR